MIRDIMQIGGGLSVFLIFMAACGGVGGSGQCGGAEATGSCLRVENIVPKYDGKDTANVDAFQDVCNLSATSTEPDFEIFRDHSAKLTISNHPMPNVNPTEISDITLQDFSITYQVNRCPGSNCPVPAELTAKPGQTVLVPVNGSVSFDLPFVPLATKFAYAKAGGPKLDFPSYTATYTLNGTDSVKRKVSAVGSAEFTIGNFDHCSG